jgi:hypothetical protein
MKRRCASSSTGLVAKFCTEKKIEIPWLLTVDFAKTK